MMLGSTYEGTSTFHVEQYVETTKLERGWGDLLLIQKEKGASWYEHTTVVKAVVGLVGTCCQAGVVGPAGEAVYAGVWMGGAQS